MVSQKNKESHLASLDDMPKHMPSSCTPCRPRPSRIEHAFYDNKGSRFPPASAAALLDYSPISWKMSYFRLLVTHLQDVLGRGGRLGILYQHVRLLKLVAPQVVDHQVEASLGGHIAQGGQCLQAGVPGSQPRVLTLDMKLPLAVSHVFLAAHLLKRRLSGETCCSNTASSTQQQRYAMAKARSF